MHYGRASKVSAGQRLALLATGTGTDRHRRVELPMDPFSPAPSLLSSPRV